MKSIIFSIMAFLILILGSCRESEYVDYYPESASKIKAIDSFDKVNIGIVARLQAYNDSLSNNDESLFSINGMSSSPNVNVALADFRGFWKGASLGFGYASVLGSDAALEGGMALGVLIGAYSSSRAGSPTVPPSSEDYNKCISAYIKMKEEFYYNCEYYLSFITLNLPVYKKWLRIAGVQHNLVLGNIMGNRFSTSSLKNAYDNEIISKSEFIVLGHRETRNIFDDFVNVQFSLNLEEKQDAIIDLYHRAIQTLANSYNDVENISNRYISEIFSSSELESSQKDILSSAICVLASSVEYWKVFGAQ